MNMPSVIRPNPGHILLPRRFVDVELHSPKALVEGKYRIRKFYSAGLKKDGTVAEDAVTLDTGFFPNIILDSGLNQWGTSSIITGAAIGTGTSTPVASQVQLDSLSHFTTTSSTGHFTLNIAGASPYNNIRNHVYRTAAGALNGNYSEVGVGWASTNLFSRALILNGGGAPTTISVASIEQVDITYQLAIYPPLVDLSATTVTISGIDYTVTGRAAEVNDGAAWGVFTNAAVTHNAGSTSYAFVKAGTMGAITTSPGGVAGSPQSSGNWTLASYVPSSLQRTCSVFYGLDYGNPAGGIQSSQFKWTIGGFQYQFSPVIPKNNTKTLLLNYSVNWARRP